MTDIPAPRQRKPSLWANFHKMVRDVTRSYLFVGILLVVSIGGLVQITPLFFI